MSKKPVNRFERLNKAQQRALALLALGPRRTWQLTVAAGTRFGARIMELRRRGYRIKSEPLGESTRQWTYRLDRRQARRVVREMQTLKDWRTNA